MSHKENAARQLAQYQSELFRKSTRFDIIGSLTQTSQESYSIGSMTSMIFSWGERGDQYINRGPFKNSFEWLSARLDLAIRDEDRILASTDVEDDIEDAQNAKYIARRLITMLPTISDPNVVEPTTLFHQDMHSRKVLVDQSGNITALLD
ncbi:hypothetical protein Slin14017_G063440 [Septoria linicola]|nr:hypothetical protein Slin14017_G063440 [Septoria linicola]